MLSLHEMRFRSSDSVELKRLDELPREQRERFRDLENDPDVYGLFVPRPPSRANLKSVPRRTAELFRRLARPARLDDVADEVIDLVLDGILEIDGGDGFVSGAGALALVSPPPPDAVLRDATARLSVEALRYAQDLATADVRLLTTALYQFNRMPLTAAWRARFADERAILAELGADALGPEWTRSKMPGWIVWTCGARPRRTSDDATYKLYVSPRPERLRDAFEVVVRVLAILPEARFKIGDRASGLLRPDKLVAYFSTRERLDEAAAALRRELAGCDAHAVPFTGGIDESGLLSWGIDPPANERPLRWLPHDSWRLWLARHLAAALSTATTTAGSAAVEPWRFAVERVRRQGVDVESWTPSAALWTRA